MSYEKNVKKKNYSAEEKRNFFEGIQVAKEDFLWCSNNQGRINACIEDRMKLKSLCFERKDKNGLSFQNGYLHYFSKKLNEKSNSNKIDFKK